MSEGQGSSLLTEERAWGNPTHSFFGVAGRCSGEASFYATVEKDSFCCSLVLSSGNKFCLLEEMRKVCVCMLGHATCQLLQLVLALPLFHRAMLQGWEFPAWLRYAG